MKIKMLIPVALVLCLAFSLCACGTNVNTPANTTAPATTTAANTEATTTAIAGTTAAATTAASASDFTEEDALELVKNTYDFDEEYFFVSDGTVEIEGTTYYAISLRKSLEANTTYISSYFVTLDGSEIKKGYTTADGSVISDEQPAIEINEDNAVAYLYARYDFEEGNFLLYKGVEEIDGTTYFAVDLMRSLEANTTYLTSYFVTEDGTIVEGYYAGGVAYLAE